MPERILVVDDELSMRDLLCIFLKRQGYETISASSGEEALDRLEKESFDLVISDVRMGEMDGISLLSQVKRRFPRTGFIIMTAFSSTADAIVAMKEGAYDYLTKPFKLDEALHIIRRALNHGRLLAENVQLKEALSRRAEIPGLIGASEPMRRVLDLIQRISTAKATVLITGESGTGKELCARAIHSLSPRSAHPFVTVNCGAIPAELMESELFGHLKGSFTGAVRDKEGLFLAAQQGVLFLDEVSELPLLLQVKLLRVLQERRFLPVGGTQEMATEARVIAATNRNLEEEVAAGRFREDLYYRLNVLQVRMPPLKERREDIPLLVRHFIIRLSDELGQSIRMSEAAMMILLSYDYPGNVRELSNIVERAAAMQNGGQIRPEDLPPSLLERSGRGAASFPPEMEIDLSKGIGLDALLEARERTLIETALSQSQGIKKEAARRLGITFRSLRYRLKKLGMESSSEEEETDD